MTLLFPQWQGAGDLPALAAGAAALAASRPDLDWIRLEPIDGPNDEASPGADGAGAHDSPDAFAAVDGVRARSALTVQLERALALLDDHRPDTLFTVAGDCSAELAPIAWLAARHPDLTVVWFDAHADLQAPATSPSGDLHGMPLRLLLGEGDADLTRRLPARLAPEQVLLAGVRAWDPAETAAADRLGLARVNAEAIGRDAAALPRALRRLGARKLYLHVDLDVLEPAGFAALGWPEPGGVGVAALTAALRRIRHEFEVVGGGLTEYLPTAGDPDDLTTARAVMDAWLP